MTFTKQPVVSVLMTAYNREEFIRPAIESVLRSVYSDFELIIVDDVSNDGTVAIAREYESKDKRVHVFVNTKNLGDYPNRNRAAELAKGKYIKYCDADDELFDFGLQVMVEAMESHPDAAYALSAFPKDNPPAKILLSPREAYEDYFNGAGYFDRAPGSAIIKTSVFRETGGFSGKRMIGDFEFWFRIGREFPMVKIPFDLYWNRLHPGQESATDYAKKNYSRLKRGVIVKALLHPDCPLSLAERTRLLANTGVGSLKEKIATMLR